ncbi:hypothetical protein BH11BAC3_BH11BAC3_45400 [soil metagenome]
MKRLIVCVLSLVSYCMANADSGKQDKPVVFTLDAATLAANKIKIKAKDAAFMPAYNQLLKEADEALLFKPVSVMEKVNFPPSGNKHDYMSIAPYFWPDSSKPNGSPYINRDGLVNPEVQQYKDKIYLAAICENVNTLALAWYFSHDAKYAQHASKLLKVWFLDADTKMNPNLDFAQAVKGRATGRGYGLIDTRHFVKLVDGIGLLNGASCWKAADQKGMQDWFAAFLNWMQTSKNGKDEMNTVNNHRVWYDEQRLAYALFTGNTTLAKEVVASAQNQLEKQMDDNGSFPLEMKRTISLHYTLFVLDPFFTIAQLAQHIGIDFWQYKTPNGKSLQKGFDVLLPYLMEEKVWEGPQILTFDYAEAVPLLVEAAEAYNCTTCKKRVNEILGDKSSLSRLHLLTGVNF